MVEPTIDDACGGRRAIRLDAEITGGGVETQPMTGATEKSDCGQADRNIADSRRKGRRVTSSACSGDRQRHHIADSASGDEVKKMKFRVMLRQRCVTRFSVPAKVGGEL